MAYDIKKLEQQALEAIKEHNLTFINEVIAYLPCASSTFYDNELEKSEILKEALEKNRIKTKNNLKAKWYRSDNATLQVALFKLLSTDEERKKLSQTYADITTGGDKIIEDNRESVKKISEGIKRLLDDNEDTSPEASAEAS